MKKLTLRSVHTERKLKYIDSNIFDESYKRDVTLFGIFNVVQTFELCNKIKGICPNKDKEVIIVRGLTKNE